MTKLLGFNRIVAAVALVAGLSLPVAAGEPRRIVAIGGSVTETLAALGLADALVGVDTTSTFPAAVVATLPKVGYMRQLSAEGVIALRPSAVLAIVGTGPADALKLIADAGVPVTPVPERFSPSGAADKIRTIGAAVGRTAEAAKLADAVTRRFEALAAGNRLIDKPVRAMFALSAQNGRLTASGRGTAADEVLRLAGTVNAVDGFDGYKPLSDEAVIAAAPEAIVVMEQGGQPAGEILAFPSLAPTPAAIAGRMIAMDGNYLLGFGPRAPEAIAALRARLYPGIVFPPLEPGQ